MARTLGSGRMIEQTSVQISTLRERWHAERELRYARRNRIRHIDRLRLAVLAIGICAGVAIALTYRVSLAMVPGGNGVRRLLDLAQQAGEPIARVGDGLDLQQERRLPMGVRGQQRVGIESGGRTQVPLGRRLFGLIVLE